MEQKWGILKYLSAEFFTEKSETIQDQTVYECKTLGQKLGNDNYESGESHTWIRDVNVSSVS